jgi:GT2 family glycosyltransferase
LLNNDTVVEPKFLDELVRVAETGEKVGSVQSVLIKKDPSKKQ